MHRPGIAATHRALMGSTAMQTAALAATLAAVLISAPQLARADWPAVNGAENERYSPLKQVDTKTVAKLGAALGAMPSMI